MRRPARLVQSRKLQPPSNKGNHVKAKQTTGLIGAFILAMSAPVLRAAPPPPPAQPPAQAESPTSDHVSSNQWQQMLSRMKLMQQQMYRIHRAKSTAEREKLLREHMRTMLEQMQAMRAMGGSMMSGMMGRGMMSGGMMGGGTTGGGMMGGGMGGGAMMGGATASGSGSGSQSATPAEQKRWLQDRLDMMQMMMEQMMGQMHAMQGMDMEMSTRGK